MMMMTYKKARRKLEHHFSHDPNPTFEQHIFRNFAPQPEENCPQFASRLRQQAALCDFGDAQQVDSHIRDQIIATCRDRELQRRLLAKKGLTLDQTLQLVRSHEVAHSAVSSMTSVASRMATESVDAVSEGLCSRCNLPGHSPGDSRCPARLRTCRCCNKKGHYAVCCRTVVSSNHNNSFGPGTGKKQRASVDSVGRKLANDITEDFVSEHDESTAASISESDFSLCANICATTPSPDHSPVYVDVEIDGKPIKMVLDTGANVSLIPYSVWVAEWNHIPLAKSACKLCSYSGTPLIVMGQASVKIACNMQTITDVVVVVKNGLVPLLGRSWLRRIHLDRSNLFAVHAGNKSHDDAILKEFPSVFKDEQERIAGHTAILLLQDGAIPRCVSARPLPYAMRGQVDLELDRLVTEGIVNHVDFSKWSSPIIIVKKGNGSIRLGADFKVTLNHYIESNIYPLNVLLQKGATWKWIDGCESVFKTVKECLEVLKHYDPTLPLVLKFDASLFGLGTCLLQPEKTVTLRPISYISRSLAKSEKNYSQIEREAPAIIFAVKRQHQYLYGRHFTLCTDHRPMIKIFGENTGMSAVSVARLPGSAVILSAYDYTVQHASGTHNVIADCSSRLPIKLNALQEDQIANFINEVSCDPCQELSVSAFDVAKLLAQDSVISKVMYHVSSGWPQVVTDQLVPYFRLTEELSIESGCLIWGNRVIIPCALRQRSLKKIHCDHSGDSRMTAVARSFFWWPKLDADITATAAVCEACQQRANKPEAADIHHCVYTNQPMQRVNIDYAEGSGVHYLLIVDAYSKWADVYNMGNSTITTRTTEYLSRFTSFCGIPSTLVSDNGPQFTSGEFSRFCQVQGIRHQRTPPYYPASNGQVERVIQELNRFLVKHRSISPSLVIPKFLFMYRNTLHTISRVTPASLLFKFTPVTRLDFLKPAFPQQMSERQGNGPCVPRQFKPGNEVWVQNYCDSICKWIKVVVMQRLGAVTYSVKVCGKQIIRHVHVNQMRLFTEDNDFTQQSEVHSQLQPSLCHPLARVPCSQNRVSFPTSIWIYHKWNHKANQKYPAQNRRQSICPCQKHMCRQVLKAVRIERYKPSTT